jgi:SHS family lactate transporter-like MFS transporter
LSGLAWGYVSFLVFRIFFGMGFGGEWSSSAALLMETLPPSARPLASGIMMAGYEVGFLLAALVFRVIFPIVGWRWMFGIGVLPSLLVLFIATRVNESPVWLAGQHRQQVVEKLKVTPAVLQGWAFMAFINFMLWSIFALYPTFLITVRHLTPAGVFPYVATYSIASIIGKPLAGRMVHRFGERPVLVTYLLLTIPSTLLYVLDDSALAMAAGAVLMGLVANSIFGIAPMYLSRRFPAARRGTGVGVGYAMTSLSVGAPYVIALVTPVLGLSVSMAVFIIGSAAISLAIAAFNTERWIPERDAA